MTEPKCFSTSPDNAFSLQGLELVPHHSGAVWIPAHETMLVADLHLEKASSFAMRGNFLPPYDSHATMGTLIAACRHFQPRRVISLGDSFHDAGARARMDETLLRQIRAFTSRYDTVWISGNHDENPPSDLGGIVLSEMQLGKKTLRHIPTGGLPLFPEIAGHLHPAATIARRGRRLRRRCFVCDGSRLILPAFGSLTGGLDVRSEAFREIFPRHRFDAWLLGRERVYKIGARQLVR